MSVWRFHLTADSIDDSNGMPIGHLSIVLAVIASMGGFISGYDTGQIDDILLMSDFLRRFGQCGGAFAGSIDSSGTSCSFTTVRSGLIVAFLSIGTVVGVLLGAPYVSFYFTYLNTFENLRESMAQDG